MSTATTMDDIDLLYEGAESVKRVQKPYKRVKDKKVVRPRSALEIARSELKTARKANKSEISKLKGEIRSKKRDIKSHRILISQAVRTFKLVVNTNPAYIKEERRRFIQKLAVAVFVPLAITGTIMVIVATLK